MFYYFDDFKPKHDESVMDTDFDHADRFATKTITTAEAKEENEKGTEKD